VVLGTTSEQETEQKEKEMLPFLTPEPLNACSYSNASSGSPVTLISVYTTYIAYVEEKIPKPPPIHKEVCKVSYTFLTNL
jgi:hypothetical protein